ARGGVGAASDDDVPLHGSVRLGVSAHVPVEDGGQGHPRTLAVLGFFHLCGRRSPSGTEPVHGDAASGLLMGHMRGSGSSQTRSGSQCCSYSPALGTARYLSARDVLPGCLRVLLVPPRPLGHLLAVCDARLPLVV